MVNGCIKLSAIRTIKVGRVHADISLQSNESTIETGKHADTTVLVANYLPINDFWRSVDVSGWYASAGSGDCPTISRSIAYDHPINRQVYMLVFHQAIQCPSLTSHSMCPMQIRMSGVIINDLPKFLAEDPDENTHAIRVDYPLNPNEPLVIPLSLKGITVYFLSSKPKAGEYEDELIPRIDLTSKAPVWEPSETSF